MAASTNIFTDKNTNNWFKACIALNFTKEGLNNFIETELQKVKAAVGINCGTCSIENLMTCPTPGLCNKWKRTICMFHQTKVPKHCKICDPVKQRIMSFHRFYNPSWRNTKAERWATDPWEIGKCYLPPDGYKSVSVLQESDFNGMISVMLNCTHFETCLSSSLSPKPPDPHCPLEKVRQIGRDVRHTADCKVTDADLKYYFQTLTTLLADPKCLMHDPSAISARTKLIQLQNDRMSLYELGELLKDASQTLKQAKEAGESYSKVAETTLQEALQSIAATIQAGKQHIETVTYDSKKQLSILTQESVKEIKEETRVGIERIQQVETDQAKKDYEREADEMLQGLTAHYDNKLSYVTTSPLRHCVQEQLRDIYMPPNMLLMANEKQSFKKTGIQITNYDRMFLKVGQENGKTFIQGEAGTGKSTFLVKLVMDWSRIKLAEQFKTRIEDTNTRTKYSTFFQDSWTLQRYRFVFLITLRNSVTEISIYNMIKEQIIDSIYASEEDRQKAYTLLNKIMKCERCLILLDGLDEWTGPGGRHSLPILVTSHRQCVLLITTRPWKVAEGKINHSEINTLLQLEGVNDPFELSRILLSFLIDRKELNDKHSEFRRYVSEQKLDDLLSSPLMLSVIVCSYADGITLKGSKCEIYCILLESLLKKANSKTTEFQHPPFPCFKETEYIQPNIELVNRLAEAAFHLLFSNTRENSLVFGVRELKQYKLDEDMDIALKSGILSATQNASALRPLSAFSFIHKSFQEFLAAYHIARKTIAIEGIIFEYLQRSDSSYLDVGQVLIFLCGLDISAANTISEMMNKCDQLHYKDYMFNPSPFQHCVLSGYREAVANAQKCINLKLSHLTINDDTIHPDLHSLWVMNAFNVESLRVTVFSRDPVSDGTSSTECVKSASSMDFQLASCHKLKVLKLYGYGICLKDSVCSAKSVSPVRFLLKHVDQAQHTTPVLLSIEHIELGDVTCSTTWLRSLFNILKTVEHNVKFVLEDCVITSCVNGTIKNSYVGARTEIITNLNGTKVELIGIGHDSDWLWEALRGLNDKSLSLSDSISIELSGDKRHSENDSDDAHQQRPCTTSQEWPSYFETICGTMLAMKNVLMVYPAYRFDNVDEVVYVVIVDIESDELVQGINNMGIKYIIKNRSMSNFRKYRNSNESKIREKTAGIRNENTVDGHIQTSEQQGVNAVSALGEIPIHTDKRQRTTQTLRSSEMKISEEQQERLRSCIQKYANDLMANHKYLSIIEGSIYQVDNGDNSAPKYEPCLVLSVPAKGFIPIGEDCFKASYDDIRVFVKEGTFRLFTRHADDHHEHVRMGCQITGTTQLGTLGVFIEHPSYGLCGITSAHVVLDIETISSIGYRNYYFNSKERKVYQPKPPYEIGCLREVIIKEGSVAKAGMEIALIQLEQRIPINGDFPEPKIGLGATDISFNSGKTARPDVSDVLCFKFGSATDYTEGTLTRNSNCVRDSLSGEGFNIHLFIQFKIKPRSTLFAFGCDSGAPVFVKDVTEEPVFLGIVVGGNDSGEVFVTHITDILQECGNSRLKSFDDIVTLNHKLSDVVQELRNKINELGRKMDSYFFKMINTAQDFLDLTNELQ